MFKGEPDCCRTKNGNQDILPPWNTFEVPDNEENAQAAQDGKMDDSKQKIEDKNGCKNNQEIQCLLCFQKGFDRRRAQRNSVATF